MMDDINEDNNDDEENNNDDDDDDDDESHDDYGVQDDYYDVDYEGEEHEDDDGGEYERVWAAAAATTAVDSDVTVRNSAMISRSRRGGQGEEVDESSSSSDDSDSEWELQQQQQQQGEEAGRTAVIRRGQQRHARTIAWQLDEEEEEQHRVTTAAAATSSHWSSNSGSAGGVGCGGYDLLDLALRLHWWAVLEQAAHSPPSVLLRQDDDGLTVLHWACCNPPVFPLFQRLVKLYASSLSHSSSRNCTDSSRRVVVFLLQDGQGLTPLLAACACSVSTAMIASLVAACPESVSCTDDDGWTALHYVCCHANQPSSSSSSAVMWNLENNHDNNHQQGHGLFSEQDACLAEAYAKAACLLAVDPTLALAVADDDDYNHHHKSALHILCSLFEWPVVLLQQQQQYQQGQERDGGGGDDDEDLSRAAVLRRRRQGEEHVLERDGYPPLLSLSSDRRHHHYPYHYLWKLICLIVRAAHVSTTAAAHEDDAPVNASSPQILETRVPSFPLSQAYSQMDYDDGDDHSAAFDMFNDEDDNDNDVTMLHKIVAFPAVPLPLVVFACHRLSWLSGTVFASSSSSLTSSTADSSLLLLQLDENGNTPLHVALLPRTRRHDRKRLEYHHHRRRQQQQQQRDRHEHAHHDHAEGAYDEMDPDLVRWLVQQEPAQAGIRNRRGQLPLQLAVEKFSNATTTSSMSAPCPLACAIVDILQAYPQAIESLDHNHKEENSSSSSSGKRKIPDYCYIHLLARFGGGGRGGKHGGGGFDQTLQGAGPTMCLDAAATTYSHYQQHLSKDRTTTNPSTTTVFELLRTNPSLCCYVRT